GRADGELQSFEYPGAVPTVAGGVRRWQAGEGVSVIAIEARPGACSAGGRRYPDTVVVTLSGRMFNGCGGSPEEERG
ncbi:MAG TPA: hypothetical protein VFR28_09865, partial [Allosphingosinicella sp.]|nr:hypothetical protein [Allosphingosinicella sp.]